MRAALAILVVLSAPFAYGALLGSGPWLLTALTSRDSVMLIYPAYLLLWGLSAIWTVRNWLLTPRREPANSHPVSGIVNVVLFVSLGLAFLAAALFTYVVLNWGEA